tara:strand:+ start:5682 stop:7571 length:1890 start_codon:yes stop_codon:yes gene_type:complete
MWSLYERKEEDSVEGAGLFNYAGEKLDPLKFSNGKTQEDIVKEILEAIKKGHKLIFIKGVCGSGKSAIALNLAKNFEKTSIIVPIKSLQDQYEKDYTQKKFITKEDGNPLKISVIKGRNNFPCNFEGGKADREDIACTIEIKEKNIDKLLKFIDMNPEVNKEDFSTVGDVKRMNVSAACPYWSPLMPADLNPKNLGNYTKKKYMAISGKEFALFQRKKGCPYYDQYISYVDSDVLIFNSMKYLIEMTIGRKPKTDLEIIDECDEFLDNFANEKRINLNRLHGALSNLMPFEQEEKEIVRNLIYQINEILFNSSEIEIKKVKNSPIIDLIELIIENPNLAEGEELNYYNNVVEIAKSFENVLDETYVSIEKIKKDESQRGIFDSFSSSEETLIINLVSINLAQKFNEVIEANNVLVLMSGTIHSPEVLRNIFGLENFKIIEAETKTLGEIKRERTGMEKNCSFANFKNKNLDRKTYLKIMDLCMANAENPTLVHVSAFKDLPSEEENKRYKFDNLITQEKLKEIQSMGNSSVNQFNNGEKKVLFTTKCSRGVDFPGDKCKSIVITRFPYPNTQRLFWKILKEEQPEKFMEFYMDKARRDLFQKISRGVRSSGDKVSLWSPDLRVINAKLF